VSVAAMQEVPTTVQRPSKGEPCGVVPKSEPDEDEAETEEGVLDSDLA
jgi:hypothetical protein